MEYVLRAFRGLGKVIDLSNHSKRLIKIMTNIISQSLKPIEFILSLNPFFLILLSFIIFLACLINSGLFLVLIERTNVKGIIDKSDYMKGLSLTTLALYASFLLEGLIATFELNRKIILSYIFTLFSLVIIVYAWSLQTDSKTLLGIGRMIFGCLLVVATISISGMCLKDHRRKWEELGVFTRLFLVIKFKSLKYRIRKNKTGLDLRLNFKQIAKVYKIRWDSLKNKLIKIDLCSAQYFKQLPPERGGKKKTKK